MSGIWSGVRVVAAVVIAVMVLSRGEAAFAENVKLKKIVVTPSRYEEDYSGVAKSVTVIDEAAIKASNARSVPELLMGSPGVDVKDLLGNGKTAQVDIRGFGESAPQNTLVMIDGRRTNQIDLSGPDWSQININSIERIEIVRGAQSVLYGDNAVGGVINLITKKGAGKKPAIQLGYEAGTYDYSAYNAAIEGGSNFLDYYSGFTQSSTDGHRTNDALELVDMTASIIAKPARYLRIKTDAGYHRDWYGQPGALSSADLGTIGRGGSMAPNDRAKTEDYYVMAGPEATYKSKSGEARFECDVSVRTRKASSIFYYTGGFTKRNNNIKTFSLTPKVTIENPVLSMLNRLVAGIDYYACKDAISSVSGAAMTELVIEKRTIGTYATDTIDITPRLSVNGGGRVEWAHFKFDQEVATKLRTIKEPQEFALEAGISYKYDDSSSVYANYSRSYRLPAVDEWFSSDYVYAGTLMAGAGLNTDLVPQEGNHFEVGIREDSAKFLNFSADYFLTYLKHEIYFNPVTYVNSVYDSTMRYGMELEAHFCPTGYLDAFARYTYEKAFFSVGAFAGNEMPGVPRDKISCGINYSFKDCVRLHYLANITGPQHFISDQANSMPKLKLYTTHDLKMSYYKYGMEAYIGIYNLLDEKYSSYGALYGTTPYYFPSPGRNVTLGAKYRF